MKHEAHEEGIVSEVWEPEGYGYLRTRAGERVFFSRPHVRDNGFEDLYVGTEVRFRRDLGPRGWVAEDVHVLRQAEDALPLS